MTGLDHATFVAARNDVERAVEFGHLIEEQRDVHGARLGHLVVPRPGAVILMPLPDIPVEGGFAVDLVLMHVDRAVEQLHHRADQTRMLPQPAISLVVVMGGKSGAHRIAAGLAPDFRAVHGENLRQLAGQHIDFVLSEDVGQENPTLFIKLLQLFGVQLHDVMLRGTLLSRLNFSSLGGGGLDLPTRLPCSKFLHLHSV